MEEWVKIIAPMVTPLVTIAALWWKIHNLGSNKGGCEQDC